MRRWLRRRVERHPLLAGAVVAAAVVVAADGAFAGWAAGVVALGLIAGSGHWRIALGCAVVAAVAGALHWHDVGARQAARERLSEPLPVALHLRLLEAPRPAGRGWAALVEVPETGERIWLRGFGRSPSVGSTIRAEGMLASLPAPRNPGEFDMRPWLERQGVSGTLAAAGSVEVVEPAPRWRRVGEGLRAAFRESVTRGLDAQSREAMVIRAVVLGEHPDDDVLIEPFRRSGTLHVFAVSGLHVGMVGMLGWLLMRALGVSRRVAVVPVVLMMFGYAWLTGMKPPAVRAAWMAAVVLGAWMGRRRPDLLNALGLAALLVVLTDGDLLFRAGVQLSFGVVLAIGALHGGVARGFRWMTASEPYLPRSLYGPWRTGWLAARRRVADLLTVSTSAWMGSAPLTAWYFGLVTPVAIVASTLLFFLVFPLLGLALLSAVVSPVPGAAETLNGWNRYFAAATLRVAEEASAIPGGNWNLPRDRPAGEFLLVYDLGEGGAACWHGNSRTVLFDAGGSGDFERVVWPSLRRMALAPESFVASHPDGNHVGGLVEALDAFPVRMGLMPVLRARGENYRRLLAAAEARGVRLVRGRAGRCYDLGEGAAAEPLAEPDGWDWDRLADERVMPVRLEWGGWRILFMADSGWGTERQMMESGVDLRADVVVAGHHQFDGNLGIGFLKSTGARAIIVGHAGFPASERVRGAWRRACEARGIAVFHQGESGAVTLTIEGSRLKLEGFVDGRVLELRAAGSEGFAEPQ